MTDGERASGPIAILAGSGELPIRLAARVRSAGRSVRILALRGFCERRLAARADAVLNLLDLRGILRQLEDWQPAGITLAGGLTRPTPEALIGAYSAYRDRDYVAAVVARGDDNLLRGAMEVLEDKGFAILGLRDLAPEFLAGDGCFGAVQPPAGAMRSVAHGFRLLDALAPFDVGQAAVLRGERVIAIEGPEGTDRMLERAFRLGRGGLFRRAEQGGVLVKGPKRGQDLRVDLPAIGPRTVRHAAKAGLEGLAVVAGYTLIIDQPATITAADAAGLFVLGVDALSFASGDTRG